MRVLVESPYAYQDNDPGNRRVGVLRNVTYARLACRDCYFRGEASYASHLFYTQPYLLDDDVPAERDFGIASGLTWGEAASLSAFYVDLGLSRGMKYGRINADKAGRPTTERRLPGWEDALDEEPSTTLIRLKLYDADTLRLIVSLPDAAWEPRIMGDAAFDSHPSP